MSFSFPVFALTGEYELLLQPEDAWGCLSQMPEPRLRISIAAYTAAIFMTQGEIYIVMAFWFKLEVCVPKTTNRQSPQLTGTLEWKFLNETRLFSQTNIQEL